MIYLYIFNYTVNKYNTLPLIDGIYETQWDYIGSLRYISTYSIIILGNRTNECLIIPVICVKRVQL